LVEDAGLEASFMSRFGGLLSMLQTAQFAEEAPQEELQ
jgi:hypothetical protein